MTARARGRGVAWREASLPSWLLHPARPVRPRPERAVDHVLPHLTCGPADAWCLGPVRPRPAAALSVDEHCIPSWSGGVDESWVGGRIGSAVGMSHPATRRVRVTTDGRAFLTGSAGETARSLAYSSGSKRLQSALPRGAEHTDDADTSLESLCKVSVKFDLVIRQSIVISPVTIMICWPGVSAKRLGLGWRRDDEWEANNGPRNAFQGRPSARLKIKKSS